MRVRHGPTRQWLVHLRGEADLPGCMAELEGRWVRNPVPIPLIHGFRCECDEGTDTFPILHRAIERVEGDIQVTLSASPFPASGRHRLPVEVPEGVQAIRTPIAWHRSQGEGVAVAVFDTGIDLRHPQLLPNMQGGVNLVNPEAPPQDDNGHGTHVAGIIAAAKTGGPVVGVAPRAGLYAVKVLDARGDGRLSDVILGLQWVVDNQIPIANLSLDIREESQSLAKAVRNAAAAGVTLIAAAGNIGKPNSVTYPACYSEVVATGAIGCDGTIPPFSSRGPQVDLVAPGVNILSTALGHRYGRASGTSAASPHVAGVAALYLALHPGAGPGRVGQALKVTAVPLSDLSSDQQGFGRVDAWNAVNYKE